MPWGWTSWVVCGLALCARAAPTELELVITSDFETPAELSALHLSVRPEGVDPSRLPGLDVPPYTYDRRLELADGTSSPASEGLRFVMRPYEPLGSEGLVIRLVVTPELGTACGTEDYPPVSLIRPFRAGLTEVVDVDITRDCCGVTCALGTHCARGLCAPDEVTCDDPPSVTLTCRVGLCSREVPRCVLGRVADCAGAVGTPDLARCGDGVDADCDGVADSGPATIQYADRDGDGYGDPDTALTACGVRLGYVAEVGDCDDENAGVHPGAVERCDGVDNDCDGVADELPEAELSCPGDGAGQCAGPGSLAFDAAHGCCQGGAAACGMSDCEAGYLLDGDGCCCERS